MDGRTTVIALLLLATIAFASEDALEAGCEVYTDYWLCPQTLILTNAPLEYSSDVECYYVNGESYICNGEARVLSDVTYEECWIYIPLEGSEIDYDGFQYNYDCRERVIKGGSTLEIATFPDQVDGCVKTEGDEYYEIQTCETTGKRISANGTFLDENGSSYMLIAASGDYGGFVMETWHWLVLIALVLALLWMLKKRNH